MRKNHIPFPFRLIFFWIVIFAIFRALFLALLSFQSSGVNPGEWPSVFLHGLKLDISASAYLSAVPALIWLIGIWTEKDGIVRSSFRTNTFLLFIGVLIHIANLAVYSAWGTLINYRAVSFLSDPKGIIASVSNLQLAGMLAAIFITCFILYRLQRVYVYIKKGVVLTKTGKWSTTLIVIFSFPLMMRGGLQVIPVNASASWFSEKMALNDAATNPVWYLFDNVNRHRRHTPNEFIFMPQSQADSLLKVIQPANRTLKTLKSQSPVNVVVIVLESWTADIIAPLGGESGTTPFFTSLCDSGLLFDSIFASGSRTDHMFPSLLAGLPSLPNKSLVRFNDKLARLPMLTEKLEKAGYTSLFFYGGELGFANMNTFLRHAGFKRISGVDDYPSHLKTGKWGVADGPVLHKMLNELDSQPSPFFSMLLTLSTHEPFDVPVEPPAAKKSEPELFRNAARYTDRCLNDFFSAAQKKKWYPNTLFILVADHGHILPNRREYYDPNTHRIPLLFIGAGLPAGLKGTRIHQHGGQHDLPATILELNGIDSRDMPFSRNILDTLQQKPAFLNYEAGIGWLEKDRQFVLLTDAGRTLSEYSHFGNNGDSISLLNRGKAYLQCLNNLFESY